jgi:hypothetical protein
VLVSLFLDPALQNSISVFRTIVALRLTRCGFEINGLGLVRFQVLFNFIDAVLFVWYGTPRQNCVVFQSDGICFLICQPGMTYL